MSSSYYFSIIGTKDNPLYELEFSSFKSANISTTDNVPGKSQFPNQRKITPVCANSSLDLIDDQAFTTNVLNGQNRSIL